MTQTVFKIKKDDEALEFLKIFEDAINKSKEIVAELDSSEADTISLTVSTRATGEELAADPYTALLLELKMNQMEDQLKWGEF